MCKNYHDEPNFRGLLLSCECNFYTRVTIFEILISKFFSKFRVIIINPYFIEIIQGPESV
jgi:hypothetical protein